MIRYIYSGRTGHLQDRNRPIEDDLDLLEKSVREANLAGPLRAIQLRAYTDDDGPTFWLCGVFEQPSWSDSRYETQSIATYDESFSESERIRRVAQALADRLRLPFHFAFEDEPQWIALQGPAPRRDFSMSWRVRAWFDDGTFREITGEDTIGAANLDAAHTTIHALVLPRMDPEAARIEIEVRNPVNGQWRWPNVLRSRSSAYHGEVEEASRHLYRDSRAASTVIREMRRRYSDLSMLQHLENLTHAFDLDLRDFDVVSAWNRGEIDDEKLNADLNARIEAQEIKWNALFTLRRRLEGGEEISAILHEHCAARGSFGFLEIVRLVALALDCYMGRAGRGKQWALCQEVVSSWLMRGSPRDDESLNEALAALIAERFPNRARNEP